MSKKSKRYILIPEPIVLDAAGADPRTVTMASFLKDTVLSDVRFGVSRDTMKMADEIEDAADHAEANGHSHIEIRDMAWDLLKACADAPHFGPQKSGYIPQVGRKLIPMIDAICEAERTAPDPAVEVQLELEPAPVLIDIPAAEEAPAPAPEAS